MTIFANSRLRRLHLLPLFQWHNHCRPRFFLKRMIAPIPASIKSQSLRTPLGQWNTGLICKGPTAPLLLTATPLNLDSV